MESPIGPVADDSQGAYRRQVMAALESPIGGGGSEGGAATQLPAAALGVIESPIARGDTAVREDWLSTPPDGLRDGRRESAAHLPIVSNANGVFNYGAPDDQRYFNGGLDRWARGGKMSHVQKQQWGALVLTRHAERGRERQGETPEDFVAETVHEKRPTASEKDRAELVRLVRSWVATPMARAKLKLDAANEYRVALRDRGRGSESEQRGWFPEMEQALTEEWDKRQARGRRITEFWMRSRARRLVRILYSLGDALYEKARKFKASKGWRVRSSRALNLLQLLMIPGQFLADFL